MAQIEIPTRFLHFTAGQNRIRVDGHNIRRVLDGLEKKFPGLVEELKSSSTVAIDGEIIGNKLEDTLLEKVENKTEIYFVPAISGG